MKKRKILQLIDGLNYGGAEVLLVDLVRGIKAAGYDVSVGYSTPGPLEMKLRDLGVPCTRLSRFGRIDPVLLYKICRLILRERPEIIHTHLFKSDLHGRLAARMCGVPVIVSTSHNIDAWAKIAPLGYIYGFTAKFADRIIAVSSEVRDYQIKYTGVPSDKIIVIENGVNVDRFNNQENAGCAFRKEFNVDPGVPLIGIIGRLQPQKDHYNFLKAAARIRNKLNDAIFLIVGDGPQKQELIAFANDLNLGSSVKFCGVRPDIPAVLAALDTLVISSKWEGLPVTLLEAMASRCPVVATTVGAIPIVVNYGEAAMLVQPDDSFALANACLEILLNPTKANSLAYAGYERVSRQYSLDAMVSKILNLYNELMDIYEAN